MHNLSNGYFQNEFETDNSEYANELSPEFEFSSGYQGEDELLPEFEFENQEMEMYEEELAQELMEITDEAEFGAWLKRLGKKAAGVAAGFLKSPAGQQATAALGDIAKKTLPGLASRAGGWAGSRLGGIVGRADYGRKLGQQYGNQAGQAAADNYPGFVKFATDALTDMSQEFEAGAVPDVKPAIVRAAKKHYPIILRVKGTLYARPQRNVTANEFEYNNEYNGEAYGETAYETDGEIADNESSFNEVTEMELASELLSLQNEAELDQFLGKLFKKAVGTVKKFASSSTGKALGGMLKGLAKKALPLAGKALGTFIAPGIGTAIGGALGTAASNLFELELEGLSAEDREFEVARAYVRFAGNAARRASRMGNGNPQNTSRSAIINAAKTYAPGLIGRRPPRRYPVSRGYIQPQENDIDNAQDGTWHRDGNRIVLLAN